MGSYSNGSFAVGGGKVFFQFCFPMLMEWSCLPSSGKLLCSPMHTQIHPERCGMTKEVRKLSMCLSWVEVGYKAWVGNDSFEGKLIEEKLLGRFMGNLCRNRIQRERKYSSADFQNSEVFRVWLFHLNARWDGGPSCPAFYSIIGSQSSLETHKQPSLLFNIGYPEICWLYT